MSTIQTSALIFNHWNVNRQCFRCEKNAKKVDIPIVERNRTHHSILTSSVIAGMLFRRSGYSWSWKDGVYFFKMREGFNADRKITEHW